MSAHQSTSVKYLDDPKERAAIEAALAASKGLQAAISAYEAAGYGSHVTDPLRDALKQVRYSIAEVVS